jgi:glycosyltransferase involved in cell wall biosynthesis
MASKLRVLALASYPELAASTRYRISQYVELLSDQAIHVDVRPFLTNRVMATLYDRRKVVTTSTGLLVGVVRRAFETLRLGCYDVVLVQREAALIGPPMFEWLSSRRLPVVLDLDDATYLDRQSAVFGGFASALKWRGKTQQLIKWADHVICGNRSIADYIERFRVPTTVIPTTVDVEAFVPRATPQSGDLVLGWIGSHSTFTYFRNLIPVLRRLLQHHRFRIRVVGAGVDHFDAPGVHVELIPWELEREIAELQSFDIAVYPMVFDEWTRGKSGLKSVQYLACGIPFVSAPVGVVALIGEPGRTHLVAETDDQWFAALSRLLTDAGLRRTMGEHGRRYAVANFSVKAVAATIADILRSVVNGRAMP